MHRLYVTPVPRKQAGLQCPSQQKNNNTHNFTTIQQHKKCLFNRLEEKKKTTRLTQAELDQVSPVIERGEHVSDPAKLVDSLRHLRPQYHDVALLSLQPTGPGRTSLLHALTPAAFTAGSELRCSLPRGGGHLRGLRPGRIGGSNSNSSSGGGRDGASRSCWNRCGGNSSCTTSCPREINATRA